MRRCQNLPWLTTDISPRALNSGARGAVIPVTITGRNFLGVTGISTATSGITVSNIQVAPDGLTMTADITVGAGVATGAKTFTISTPTGSPTFTFAVN